MQATAGFVLYNGEKKITSMFTLKDGQGIQLFNRVAGFMLKNGWEKLEIAYDDNNQDLKPFYEKAIAAPLSMN